MRTVLIVVLAVIVLFVIALAFFLCKATAERERAFQEMWKKTKGGG